MALVNTTLASDVTAPVNFVLMRGLLTQTKKKLPFHNGTVAGELAKHNGSLSVKWRKWDDLTVNTTALGEAPSPIVYGMGRDAEAASVTDISVATAKYGKLVTYNEEVDIANVNTRAAEFMTPIGRNAGVTLDKLMSAVYDAETTAYFADGAANTAAVNDPIDLVAIDSSFTDLDAYDGMTFEPMSTGSTIIGSSPLEACYLGICHPHVAYDIRKLTGFKPVSTYGSHTSAYVGEIGEVNGVRWVASSNAPVDVDGGSTTINGMRNDGTNVSVYSSFIYAMNAVGSVGLGENHTQEIYEEGTRPATIEIINHPMNSGGLSNPFHEVGGMAWKAWWAGKVLDSSLLKKIESGASIPA